MFLYQKTPYDFFKSDFSVGMIKFHVSGELNCDITRNKLYSKNKHMQRLWRSSKNIPEPPKKQQPSPANESNLLLPNQIGCRIIQIEMEVMQTQNLTKQLILELLEQYSKAVEFFEERGSPKYLLYQKRLQGFLSKPAIAEIMNGKTGTLLIKKEKNQEELKKVQTQSQVVAKKLMEDSKQSGQKQEDIIKKELQNQEKNLEERIQRKRAISNKSTKQKSNVGSFTAPQEKNGENSKEENIDISEFMQNPNLATSSGNKKNPKVFI